MEKQRNPGIDRLKATAIVAVVWIHCFNQWGAPRSLWAQFSTLMTAFAVPGFFFASGFVHSRLDPFPPGTLARWARRILVPYAIASLFAFALRKLWLRENLAAMQVVIDLLIGNALGIYYFVPVLCMCLGIAVPLARWPRLLIPLWLVFAAGPALASLGRDPVSAVLGAVMTVEMRNPWMWAGYFLSGWGLARYQITVPAAWLLFAWVAATGAMFALPQGSGVYLPVWVHLVRLGYVYIPILALAMTRGSTSPFIRWLSNSTYGVYLYHFLILCLLAPPRRNGLSEPARFGVFALGLALSLLFVAGVEKTRFGRTVLG
jgi:peptidoglycan/LPS O-acetylase OafA/YrhL